MSKTKNEDSVTKKEKKAKKDDKDLILDFSKKMETVVAQREKQEKELKEKQKAMETIIAITGVERVPMLGRIFIRVGNVYYDAFSIRKVTVTPAYLTFNVWMKKVTIPFSYGNGVSYKDVEDYISSVFGVASCGGVK